jgi:hypothetical protein
MCSLGLPAAATLGWTPRYAGALPVGVAAAQQVHLNGAAHRWGDQITQHLQNCC